ncbi:MAG: polysaccharide biosynthesis/export family protein [Acetobacteraceae bacterium]|nr:polysaccharide biosynthesis/export family protein [Acetobacteraceae bacterium]
MSPTPLKIGRRGALLGTVGLVIAGCGGPELQPLPNYQAGAYRLGPGDLLRVLTFGEDQLTGEFRVDDQGNIGMPLVGSIPATGKTQQQLENDISRALVKGDFLKNPHVTVEVIAYRPIFVLGEVAKPGQYPYQPGMTFLTAVAIAGGFTYRAVESYGEVVRAKNGVAVNGRVTSNTFLAPGDVVRVLERYF